MDKLQALKNGALLPDDISITIDENKSGETFMQRFFEDVELVKASINVIRDATKKIAEINQNVVLATTNAIEQDVSMSLQPIIVATNKQASIAKQMLQRLREELDKLKGSKEAEIRIRENLVNTLTRKFVDVMKEYQSSQTKYKTDIKKKVRRQVQIVRPEATNEEIDAVMKTGKGAEELIQTTILKGEAADAVRNACLGVADKYQDVLALEASVAELHQMFLDFALLTEQQGELLDQIENQVKNAQEYITQANVDLGESITLQKSIRAKQCCVATFVLVVILIIIGAVLASTAVKNGGHLRK